MGTDIRAFIEYRSASNEIWRTHSEVFLERDYDLFAAMAKVRCGEDRVALFEPRSFPADASAFAQRAYYAHIVPDDESVYEGLFRFVRASQVASIVGSGGHYRPASKDLISGPDSFSPSWLSIGEIHNALQAIGSSNKALGMAWQLALRTMEAIEAEFRAQVRLTFWFEI